jgi:general secretion pathway protein A
MGAETLEELRMLSNINADKDQALQVILVGQRELRDTLRRPDLVQFAQRISVDYHLEPLSEPEVIGYIRHRVTTAGGKPELFSEEACRAAHRFSGGIPRLINQLCDNAMVYGYAEQSQQIDSQLINDVAYEKQKGGIFPVYAEAEPPIPRDVAPEPQLAPEAATEQTVPAVPAYQSPPRPSEMGKCNTVEVAASADTRGIDEYAKFRPENTTTARPQIVPAAATPGTNKKNNARIAVASTRATLCHYLSRLLESYGFEIVSAGPFNEQFLGNLKHDPHDALLIDRYEDTAENMGHLVTTLDNWQVPVLFNDSMITEISLQQGSPEFGKELADRLTAIMTEHPVAHAGP